MGLPRQASLESTTIRQDTSELRELKSPALKFAMIFSYSETHADNYR